MNEEQVQIWEYLNQHAQGHESRRSSYEIREELGLESGGVTNEHVRGLIRDMILNHNCCIGSDSKGYWMITNKGELDQVVTSLINRADEIRERARALENNCRNRVDG